MNDDFPFGSGDFPWWSKVTAFWCFFDLVALVTCVLHICPGGVTMTADEWEKIKGTSTANQLLFYVVNRRRLPGVGYLSPYERQPIATQLTIDAFLRLGLIDEFDPLKWRTKNPPPRPSPYYYTGQREDDDAG